MKYLAFIKPSKEVIETITARNDVTENWSDLHITLSFFYMDKTYQERLQERLEHIKFQPFAVRTEAYDVFDKDTRVIRVSKPPELQELHERIIEVVSPYVENWKEHEERVRKYCLMNYQPHITIADSRDVFDSNNSDMLNLEFIVDEFRVHRKNSFWHEVHRFRSQ
jgi:2'-5' RNA ligase